MKFGQQKKGPFSRTLQCFNIRFRDQPVLHDTIITWAFLRVISKILPIFCTCSARVLPEFCQGFATHYFGFRALYIVIHYEHYNMAIFSCQCQIKKYIFKNYFTQHLFDLPVYHNIFPTIHSILGGLDKIAKTRQDAHFIYKLFKILRTSLLSSR